jgi:hypothetical protein
MLPAGHDYPVHGRAFRLLVDQLREGERHAEIRQERREPEQLAGAESYLKTYQEKLDQALS